MKKLLLASLTFLVFQTLCAQTWQQDMQSGNGNFYTIQKKFYSQFNGPLFKTGDNFAKDGEKELDGYEVFKRWEYFMEPRVYPSGKLPKPDVVWQEMKKYKKMYPQYFNSDSRSIGNWSIMPLDSYDTSYTNGTGRMNCIEMDPTDSNILYSGSPSGGFWKSNDGGKSWITTTDNEPVLGVSAIAIDPNNHNIIYIGTGDGEAGDNYSVGILKSIDGGNTWDTTGLNWINYHTRTISEVLIDPTNSDIMFAATSQGTYRSTDAGASWSLVLPVGNRSLVFNPKNHNTLYSAGIDFYRSYDNGVTFTQITSGLPADTSVNRLTIGVTAADTNYIYVVAGDIHTSGFYGLYRSTDNGTNFTLQSNSPNLLGWNADGSDVGGQSWYTLALAVNPNNKDEVYVGGVDIWKSSDGGVTWTLDGLWYGPPYAHADVHTLRFFGDRLYDGCDGGVWWKYNTGAPNWHNVNKDLRTTEYYRFGGGSTVAPDLEVGGTQDNGTYRDRNGAWSIIAGGDGEESIVDYQDSDFIYASVVGGYILRSNDGGNTFNWATNGITESGSWVTPFVMDPKDHNTLYAGFVNVWKTTDRGNNWSVISAFTSTANIQSLTVAPSDSKFIYAATYNQLYKTTDGGTTWTDITTGLPVSMASITYIAVSSANSNHLWVTFSGYMAGIKVFESKDGGNNWINVSGNLPVLPANCIVYQKNSPDGIYIGTEAGVFYKDTTLSNWQPYMNGLPNVIIEELEINYKAKKLRTATYGRSLWQSDLWKPVASPPTAAFVSDVQTICPGQTVQFTDMSLNASPKWQWFFPGGNPGSSTIQDPVVTYDTAGKYTVTLIATNSYGRDTAIKKFYIDVAIPIASPPPVQQGFELSQFPPGGWEVINPDNGITWAQTNYGSYGKSSYSTFMNNFYTGEFGQQDILQSPAFYTANAGNKLTFDMAYAAYGYGYYDTLIIMATPDCGLTEIQLYKNGGESLETVPDQYINYLPTPGDWRTDTVDLTKVLTYPQVQLQFIDVTGWGNNLYIDNINIPSITGLQSMAVNKSFNIYPNPANDQLTIDNSELTIQGIRLVNVLGQIVFDRSFSNSPVSKITIDVSSFPKGMYMVEVFSGSHTMLKKVVLE